MSFNAYVYIVKNKLTGEFYYGYRSANIRFHRTPQEDFWVHYKTSSKNLKLQISEDPSQFEWQILFEGTPEECYWQEQTLIMKNFKSKGCLNRHYATPGSQQFWKASPGAQRGKPKSQQHRENISKARRGKSYPISPEGLARRSAATMAFNRARKGIPKSEEVKERLKGMGAGENNANAKIWVIEHEDGSFFEMRGIKPWCVKHGLIQATLKKTLITKRFYKGYRVMSLAR